MTPTLTTQCWGFMVGSALWVHTVSIKDDLVWAPDVYGSAAFLVSAAMAVVAYAGSNKVWNPGVVEWW